MNNVIEAVQIGVDNAVPVALSQGGKRAVADNARVADNAVVGAELLDIPLNLFATLLPLADVKTQEAAIASRTLNLIQRFFCAASVA